MRQMGSTKEPVLLGQPAAGLAGWGSLSKRWEMGPATFGGLSARLAGRQQPPLPGEAGQWACCGPRGEHDWWGREQGGSVQGSSITPCALFIQQQFLLLQLGPEPAGSQPKARPAEPQPGP